MNTQPEALRLADLLDERRAAVYRKHTTEAAAELRRLHQEVGRMRQALRTALAALGDASHTLRGHKKTVGSKASGIRAQQCDDAITVIKNVLGD